jgi:hypothetical protein
MNNSGNTETFKFSGYTSALKYTNDTDRNIVSINYPNSAVDGITSVLIGGDNRNYITTPNTLGLSGHTILNSSNSYIDFDSGTWPGFSGIYSAQNAYINGSAWGATIIGGVDNYITTSPFAIVLGGQSNRVRSSSGLDNFNAARGAILGGFNNEIVSSAPYENSAIIGGTDSTITDSNKATIIGGGSSSVNTSDYSHVIGRNNNITTSNDCAVVGGHGNGITSSFESGIFAGYSNTMTTSLDSAILGGRGNLINNGAGCCGGSVVVGGTDNYIYNSPGIHNGIFAGQQNFIVNNSPKSTAMGGGFNTIDSSLSSAFIASSASTISGKTQAVMIGTTSGRTADKDYTTYVENLRIYRQSISGNYDNGSQSTGYSLNWDNGNIQKLTLTGNLAFSATNISDGATYVLKLVQDGSGNRTATWTSSQFKFPNGTAPTLSTGANDVDIITFVAMDGVLYGVAQKNFS